MCIMSVNNAMRAGRVRTKKELRDKYGVGWSKKDLIKLLEKDYDKYLQYVAFSCL